MRRLGIGLLGAVAFGVVLAILAGGFGPPPDATLPGTPARVGPATGLQGRQAVTAAAPAAQPAREPVDPAAPRGPRTPEPASRERGSALVTVSGQVLWEDGQPARGAEVRFATEGIPVELAFPGVASDAGGRFEMDVPAGRRIDLVAELEGVRSPPAVAATRAGGAVDRAVLWLPGRAAIVGRLVTAGGAPLSGQVRTWQRPDPAAVSAADDGVWERLQRPLTNGYVGTDESGRFAFQPPPRSEVWLLGTAPGWPPSQLVHLDASQRPAEVTLRLASAAGIGGVLVREDGSPIAGGTITVAPSGIAEEAWLVCFPGLEPQTTDEDGRFAFESVPAAPAYRLAYRPRPGEPVRATLDGVAPDHHDVVFVVSAPDLAPTTLRGVLRDADGETVSEYWVTPFAAQDGTPASLASRLGVHDERGAFTLASLPRGVAVRLLVHPRGGKPFVAGPWRTDADEVEVEVVVPRPGTLAVRAWDARGRPAAGAWVTAAAQPALPVTFGGRIGEDGLLQLTGVSPGSYRVTVRRGEQEAQREVEVHAGRTRSILVRLRP